MDTARYVFALLVVLLMPAAFLFWLVLHPWAAFWRRVGPAKTYTLVGLAMLALAVALYPARAFLVGRDLGTSTATLVAAALCYAVAVWIALARRRHLTKRILVGLPELSEEHYPGTLLSDGVYARVRHPRYVEVVFGIAAMALFSNYVGSYVVTVLCLPLLWILVVVEERELVERFGQDYVDYARRVPRFVPRFGRSADPR